MLKGHFDCMRMLFLYRSNGLSKLSFETSTVFEDLNGLLAFTVNDSFFLLRLKGDPGWESLIRSRINPFPMAYRKIKYNIGFVS